MQGSLEAIGRDIRAQVLQRTGIPTGVGIATTKTLAKLANYAAKKWQQQTGGVVDIRDPERRDKLLKVTPVEEVWGVGRRMNAHLQGMNIKTAWELSQADPWTLRKQFSVVLEKTVLELRGTPCMDVDHEPAAQQQMMCSRSFGSPVTELPGLIEVVSQFASRVAEKARQQEVAAGAVKHAGLGHVKA